jgi:hypothetical protein
VHDQWKVKQGFALDADKQSRQLLAQALGGARPSPGTATPEQPKSSDQTQAAPTSNTAAPGDGRTPADSAVDVFNTCSWQRTDLVTLSSEQSAAGDRVVDANGKVVPSQRLANGQLVFLARKVPAMSAERFRVETGAAPARGSVKAEANMLVHPEFTVRIDEHTGAIVSLFSRLLDRDLVDAKAATALNDYFYLPGSDLKGLERNGPPSISVKEKGPLVASLLIESDAPGCKRLLREVRVLDGLDSVEIIDTIDKLPVRAKEGIHFGFGFNVPDGTMRLDVGWATVRPELDQIPAACKNWFSVQRWVGISNDRFRVTWSPMDAPQVEVGGITGNLIGSQTNPDVWIQHLQPSQTIYSWVMNNHWHTNYRVPGRTGRPDRVPLFHLPP